MTVDRWAMRLAPYCRNWFDGSVDYQDWTKRIGRYGSVCFHGDIRITVDARSVPGGVASISR